MTNANKSNWDDSEQHPTPKAAAPAAAVHDGFDDSHADSRQDSTQEVVDATVRKKSNPLIPRILMGVMGLAVLGVLGFFGMRVMDTLGGKKSAPQVAKVQKQITEMPRPGVGTPLMDEQKPANPPVVSSVQPTPEVVAPVAPVAPVAAANPIAPATTGAPPVVAAPVVAPAAALPDGRLAQANDRARQLEDEVRTLREQLARQSAASAQAAVARAPADTSAPRVPRAHRTARAKSDKSGKVESPIITEVAEKETPVEIARLQLRGVFPRSGDDMQAWLMDGDKTRAVSKGDVINGAKVIRVETDRVVTDRGLIR